MQKIVDIEEVMPLRLYRFLYCFCFKLLLCILYWYICTCA